ERRGARLDAVRRPYQHVERPKARLLQAKRLAQAALDAVALNCPGRMLARHQQAQSRPTRIAALQIERVAGHLFSPAFAQQAFELRFLRETAGCTQPEALFGRGYSPRRRRPRARRLRKTARPPRVPLRTRNPWRRARRVLEGW